MASKAAVEQELKKKGLLGLIGNTPLIRVDGLSELSGREIFMKCETFNPGGTIKDRPALGMVIGAIAQGKLRPGMTIVEGTAGNTGIGLAMVGQSLGYKVIVVLPKGQDPSKLRLLNLYGAQIHETEAVMYPDERHFFLLGKKIGTSSPDYWWANQFDNPDNWLSHYEHTAPEMWRQMEGRIDHLVCAAGSSGTIAGISKFIKERTPSTKVTLVDPHGSGLCRYFHQQSWEPEETYSMAEGVGITRPTANFAAAQIDGAFTLPDQALTTLAYYVREKEGLVMGMSSMLNLAGAFKHALTVPVGSRVVTIMCDGGERATGKMYSAEFLQEKKLDSTVLSDRSLLDYFSNL